MKPVVIETELDRRFTIQAFPHLGRAHIKVENTVPLEVAISSSLRPHVAKAIANALHNAADAAKGWTPAEPDGKIGSLLEETNKPTETSPAPVTPYPLVFNVTEWTQRITAASKRRWPLFGRRMGLDPGVIQAVRELHHAAYRARDIPLWLNLRDLLLAVQQNRPTRALKAVQAIVKVNEVRAEEEATERELLRPGAPRGVRIVEEAES